MFFVPPGSPEGSIASRIVGVSADEFDPGQGDETSTDFARLQAGDFQLTQDERAAT